MPEATFKSYPGVGHTRTAEMDADDEALFKSAMAGAN